MEEYPREVSASPLLLSALVGSTHLHARLTEALNESAVAACGQRRVRYLSLEYDWNVPPPKRGGQDSPGYIVEGILKRRWLEKVCNEIPAVATVMFDWSGESQPPLGDEAQVSRALDHARRQANSRDIRLLVLAVVPADGSDPEAAAQLRQQPDVIGLVTAKGQQDIVTKASRLEKLIYQHAMTFYADEEKRHKRQRMPSPAAPPPLWMTNALQVRAQIKIGYTCELRKDTRGALKSYIKAYEQLIHDTEIADVVERIGLCNHITVRMYQLYLQSHDLGLAVHHCGIHNVTLRQCSTSEKDSGGAAALVWRKRHWLAGNHQLFAELLEGVVQQMPLLIDQNDMYQFPGFHYQAAATYIGALKQWASSAAVSVPIGRGGGLKPSPYIGQAGRLERPTETPEPAIEVAARCAQLEAQQTLTGDRCLQLLIRAHAASKERDYKARTHVCTARMADEYLSEGNLQAAAKLYERLRQPSSPDAADPGVVVNKPSPVWPALHRFALQRAICCSCRELKLQEPSLCSHGCSAAPGSKVLSKDNASAGKPSSEADISSFDPVAQAEEEVVTEREEAARRRLLVDSFEYLSLPDRLGRAQLPSIVKAHESELLSIVQEALGGIKTGVEVGFGGASAKVGFDRAGVDEAEVIGVSVKLRSPLAVSLKVSGVVAITSLGDVALQALVDTWPQEWGGGQDLELRGTWKALGESSSSEVSVSGIRVSWTPSSTPGAPSCSLIIKDVQAAMTEDQATAPLLPPFQLPSLSASSSKRLASSLASRSSGRPQTDGAVRSQPPPTPFRTKVFFPVDPATAIMSERFVFHLLIIGDGSHGGGVLSPGEMTGPSRSLSLSCTARVEEVSEELGGDHSGDIRISLLSRSSIDAPPADWAEMQLLPDARSPAELVAEMFGDNQSLRPVGTVLSIPSNVLVDGPTVCGENEHALAVPIVVSCDKSCKATISFSVTCSSPSAASSERKVPGPQASLTFSPAVQVNFEDKVLGAMGPGQTSGAIRKIALQSLAKAKIELLRICAQPGERAALGVPGHVAPQSQHVFALPPGATGKSLAIQLRRADAVSAFFPWLQSRALLPASPLPAAASEWPLPAEPAKAAPAALGILKVELRHHATGIVAESIDVRVVVRRTTQSIQELRVRVLQEAEHGGPSDRFFIGGPMSTQAVLISATDLEPQVCCNFSLVPLKPGWLQVPRVQVSTGNQEVASTPSSIFIFPSTQSALWRSNS